MPFMGVQQLNAHDVKSYISYKKNYPALRNVWSNWVFEAEGDVVEITPGRNIPRAGRPDFARSSYASRERMATISVRLDSDHGSFCHQTISSAPLWCS